MPSNLAGSQDGTKRYGAVLRKAEELINKDRRDSYGPVEESFKQAAEMWSLYLGHKVTPKDLALCMALLKICRESVSHKEDNLVDAAGYVGLAAVVAHLD